MSKSRRPLRIVSGSIIHCVSTWLPELVARALFEKEMREVNLNAVFHLFLTPGNEQLTTDTLRDARRYLLDAKGTLSLLLNDLTRGDPNPTRLPANAMQAPLRDLRESVTQLLYILSVETEKREQESAFYADAAYSAGVTSTQLGPGRRRYDISKD